jgi:hypothetical protein
MHILKAGGERFLCCWLMHILKTGMKDSYVV